MCVLNSQNVQKQTRNVFQGGGGRSWIRLCNFQILKPYLVASVHI